MSALTERQQANARAAGLTDLEHRWNLAATRAGFAGSEFIDEPERVFAEVQRRHDSLWRQVKKLRREQP